MRNFFALALTVLALSSCAKDRLEMLTDRADAYNRSIRWGSLTAAGSLISGESRRSLLAKVSEDLNRNRVVDYSIIDLSMDEGRESGTVVVEYSLVSNATQEMKYRQEAQTWKYNSKQKEWFLADVKSMSSN